MHKVSIVLAIWLASLGCGRSSGPTSSTQSNPPPIATRPADIPAHIYGSFAESADVPDVAANGGNVVLVIPSYADDAERVASALQSNGKVAILSAHHVFGNHESTWEAGWAQTLKWAEPLTRRGLLAAVYVVDEPLWNGIPPTTRDRAIARVRADGYKTMVAEWVEVAVRSPRAPSDLYGATCYDWPGEGSWTLERCREAYRTHPEWNIVIGQGYNWHVHSGKGAEGSESITSQIAGWIEIGRQRDGVIFWVWRWPGQEGIGDNPEARAAYHKGAGW